MSLPIQYVSVKVLLLTERWFADAPKGIIRDYKLSLKSTPVQISKSDNYPVDDASPSKATEAYQVRYSGLPSK